MLGKPSITDNKMFQFIISVLSSHQRSTYNERLPVGSLPESTHIPCTVIVLFGKQRHVQGLKIFAEADGERIR